MLACPACGGPLPLHTTSMGYGPRLCLNAPPFLWVADTPGGKARYAADQLEAQSGGPWEHTPEEPHDTPRQPSPGWENGGGCWA